MGANNIRLLLKQLPPNMETRRIPERLQQEAGLMLDLNDISLIFEEEKFDASEALTERFFSGR